MRRDAGGDGVVVMYPPIDPVLWASRFLGVSVRGLGLLCAVLAAVLGIGGLLTLAVVGWR